MLQTERTRDVVLHSGVRPEKRVTTSAGKNTCHASVGPRPKCGERVRSFVDDSVDLKRSRYSQGITNTRLANDRYTDDTFISTIVRPIQSNAPQRRAEYNCAVFHSPGCPSPTDSEVNRNVSPTEAVSPLADNRFVISGMARVFSTGFDK